MNEYELLSEALKRTDLAERSAFLDQTCAEDSEPRRRLEELLGGYADSGGPLDQAAVAPEESTATAEVVTPIATGERRPGWATDALERPDTDATTAGESASSVKPWRFLNNPEKSLETGCFPVRHAMRYSSLGCSDRIPR
jgi:hypothetical protein